MMDEFDERRPGGSGYGSRQLGTDASQGDDSRRHGDEFIDDLIAQARSVKLPPPAVSPGFVLARAARKREQRRAFAAGFAGAVLVAIVATNIVRTKLASPESSTEGLSVGADRLAKAEVSPAGGTPTGVRRDGTCIPKPSPSEHHPPDSAHQTAPGRGALDSGQPGELEPSAVAHPSAPGLGPPGDRDSWTVEGSRCTPSQPALALPPSASAANAPAAPSLRSTATPQFPSPPQLGAPLQRAPTHHAASSSPVPVTPKSTPGVSSPSRDATSRLSFGGRK